MYVGDASCAPRNYHDMLPRYARLAALPLNNYDDPLLLSVSEGADTTGGFVESTVTDITREEAEELLEQQGLSQGSYVLRKSISCPGSFVFVVVVDTVIHHFPVERVPQRGYIVFHHSTKRLFPSLDAALNFYSTVLEPQLGVQLGRRLDMVDFTNPS